MEGTATFRVPTDVNSNGIVFTFIVRNEHGLSYTREITLVQATFEAFYNRWEDPMNTSVNSNSRDFVVVGEEVRYYVNISATSDPSEVYIDGIRVVAYDNDAPVNKTITLIVGICSILLGLGIFCFIRFILAALSGKPKKHVKSKRKYRKVKKRK